MNFSVLKIVFLPFLLLSLSTSVFAESVSVNQSVPIHLCGVLTREVSFGPPGFGETPSIDLKRSVWLLTLPNLVSFRYINDNNENVDEVLKKIQIRFSSDSFKNQLQSRHGKTVMTKGIAWSAITEGDITPVVLELRTIAIFHKPTSCKN